MKKAFIIVILLLFSCSTEPEENHINPYEGYSRTAEDSPTFIGIIDTNDWRTIPEIDFVPFPAFPNPCLGYFTIFQFEINSTEYNYKIYTHDWITNKYYTFYDQKFVLGRHSIQIDIDTTLKRERMIRLFVEATRGSETYMTYGDILYQPN